ncbi:Uricase [Grifola frondosa]|uniref:Uricase n=1 Tax=Grifola frondosa TaxID=5627 RepID=A0A1C7M9Q1_GRIFR|nr:Uricase [Grifola frondosa]
MSVESKSYLSHARYGKDKVRVFRIVREGSWHHVVEYNVTALLEGDIDVSYTKADNSVIVATDSIKNITYCISRESVPAYPVSGALRAAPRDTPRVQIRAYTQGLCLNREAALAAHPGGSRSGGAEAASILVFRDGDDKRVTSVEVDASAGKDKIVAKVTSGITDLLVLKSSGSAFESFVRDEYTTLAEVNDRIFSTSIDLTYAYAPFAVPAPRDEKRLVLDVTGAALSSVGTPWDGDKVAEAARKITLEVFAEDESASVQATLYKMAQQIIADNVHVESVTYTLPNKHYVPVDMKYIGVDNLTPSKAEVFVPIAAPSGLISATITRK